ncbi:MAG: CBS domain-containing protein [Actinomycetota bacterium]
MGQVSPAAIVARHMPVRAGATRRVIMAAMKTVGEIMSTDLITVEPSTTVAEAATLMGARHVGSALVMEGDNLSGIFTERDIVRALAAHFDAARHPVSQWMTTEPKTVGLSASENEALDIMLAGGFRHLPVMQGDTVAGIISMRDVSHHAEE